MFSVAELLRLASAHQKRRFETPTASLGRYVGLSETTRPPEKHEGRQTGKSDGLDCDAEVRRPARAHRRMARKIRALASEAIERIAI